MIDLRNFSECSARKFASKNETYIISTGDSTSVKCFVSLGASDCSEVSKFIGKQVRILASDEGEVVIARGDYRLTVTNYGRGQISASRIYPIFEKVFPDFKRVPMKGKWETDKEGNSVYLLTPTGSYEKDERIVMGRRLEDKR